MKKKVTLLFSSLLALAAINASAQAPVIEWEKTYGGSAEDQISEILGTPDGGYVFIGYSTSGISGEKTQPSRGDLDVWLVKAAADGTVQMDKTIGGSATDNAVDIKPTQDGGYIILANSNSGISGDKTDTARAVGGRNGAPEVDYWVIKMNATLDTIQWQRGIGGNSTERPANIVPARDGGYFVGGYSRSGIFADKTIAGYRPSPGTYDHWVLKLSSTGSIQWQKQMGGIKDDYMNSMIATSDGGFIAGGYSDTSGTHDMTDSARGGSDYWIVKCDASGTIQWDKTYGGSNSDKLYDIKQTSDGGYILAGSSTSDRSGDKTERYITALEDYWIVKIDDTGRIEWERTLGGTSTDQAFSVVQTSDGGYVIAGESSSPANASHGTKQTEVAANTDAFHYWLVKLDYAGNEVWEKSIGGDSTDKPSSIIATPDGGFLVGGYSISDSSGDKSENRRGSWDFWVVKLGKDCTSDTTKTYVADKICNNGTYTLPSGAVVSGAGVHYDTLISSANCDSMLVFTLTESSVNTGVTVSNGTATAAAQGASYQWINCADNQPIQGETNASYTPSSTGNYAVVVTVDGCSDTSECQEIIPTGVNDHDRAGQVRIYPNPVSGQLYVNAPFAINITISTMDGRIALAGDQVNTLDVSGLSEGVYLLRATDESGTVIRTEKLVKVK